MVPFAVVGRIGAQREYVDPAVARNFEVRLPVRDIDLHGVTGVGIRIIRRNDGNRARRGRLVPGFDRVIAGNRRRAGGGDFVGGAVETHRRRKRVDGRTVADNGIVTVARQINRRSGIADLIEAPVAREVRAVYTRIQALLVILLYLFDGTGLGPDARLIELTGKAVNAFGTVADDGPTSLDVRRLGRRTLGLAVDIARHRTARVHDGGMVPFPVVVGTGRRRSVRAVV